MISIILSANLDKSFSIKLTAPGFTNLFLIGCRALRSTGLSDIILSPATLDDVQPEIWRECLDIFDLENARQFWPKEFDKLEKLELLRRHNLPGGSVELISKDETPTAAFAFDIFENVTLDLVDAFVESDHQVQWPLTCCISYSLSLQLIVHKCTVCAVINEI